MPTKKSNVQKAVEQALPGWKIVKRSPLTDKSAGPSAHPQADAVSPGLAAQKIKIGAVAKAAVKRAFAKKKTEHAQFVTVAPSGQPDSVRKFQKVVLVKGNKVIAQQG
jgi:hypothetical protein